MSSGGRRRKQRRSMTKNETVEKTETVKKNDIKDLVTPSKPKTEKNKYSDTDEDDSNDLNISSTKDETGEEKSTPELKNNRKRKLQPKNDETQTEIDSVQNKEEDQRPPKKTKLLNILNKSTYQSEENTSSIDNSESSSNTTNDETKEQNFVQQPIRLPKRIMDAYYKAKLEKKMRSDDEENSVNTHLSSYSPDRNGHNGRFFTRPVKPFPRMLTNPIGNDNNNFFSLQPQRDTYSNDYDDYDDYNENSSTERGDTTYSYTSSSSSSSSAYY